MRKNIPQRNLELPLDRNHPIDQRNRRRVPTTAAEIRNMPRILNHAPALEKKSFIEPVRLSKFSLSNVPEWVSEKSPLMNSNIVKRVPVKYPPKEKENLVLLSQHESTIFHDAFSKDWLDIQLINDARSSVDRPVTAFRMSHPDANYSKEFSSKSIPKPETDQNIIFQSDDIGFETKKPNRMKRNEEIAKRYSVQMGVPRVQSNSAYELGNENDMSSSFGRASLNIENQFIGSYSENAKDIRRSLQLLEPNIKHSLNRNPKDDQNYIAKSKLDENESKNQKENTINKFWKSLYMQQSQIQSRTGEATGFIDQSKILPNSINEKVSLNSNGKENSENGENIKMSLFANGVFQTTKSNESTPESLSFNTFPVSLRKLDIPTTSLDSDKRSILATEQLHNLSFMSSSSDSDDARIEFQMGIDESRLVDSLADSTNDNFSKGSFVSISSVQGPRPMPEWVSKSKPNPKTSTTTKEFLDTFGKKSKRVKHKKKENQDFVVDIDKDEVKNDTVGTK